MAIQKVTSKNIHRSRNLWQLAPVFCNFSAVVSSSYLFTNSLCLFSFSYILRFSLSLLIARSLIVKSQQYCESDRSVNAVRREFNENVTTEAHERERVVRGRENVRGGHRTRIYWYKTTVVSLQCVWERPWVETRWSAGTDEDCHWVSVCVCVNMCLTAFVFVHLIMRISLTTC